MSRYWNVGMTLRDSEEKIILDALQYFQYNKTMTARSLGISIRGLDLKMEEFQIENKRNDFKGDESKPVDSGADKKEDSKNSKKRDIPTAAR